ncbi:MAG: DUF2007 domain-containing protein [Gammaproteobacteria bacterium]|nr:DUF2007 domain-containing protein [Gammaproteobacteria bacterium]
MKTVFTTVTSAEAHLVVHLLARHNIAADISGEALQGALGELPVFGNVRVKVAAADEARAKQLIAEWEQTSDSSNEWRCNACAETNPGSFEFCWQCGASAAT